jgi:hypothetical protein
MKMNTKPHCCNFFLSEGETLGLLHKAPANFGYFIVLCQFLQLPSTQSESPLSPKSHVPFKACTQL